VKHRELVKLISELSIKVLHIERECKIINDYLNRNSDYIMIALSCSSFSSLAVFIWDFVSIVCNYSASNGVAMKVVTNLNQSFVAAEIEKIYHMLISLRTPL
jgi:hypothetical protein